MSTKFVARLVALVVFTSILGPCGVGTARGAKRPAHVRLRTPHGPILVWTPATFDRETAEIVIYVHGYFTAVDDAWRRHRLARQFAASGLNALFIACEAPTGPNDDLDWPSVGALLAAVAERVDTALPEGRIVVVGHSGAHRTIKSWLGDDPIDTIVLVDALYGDMPEIRAWLEADDERRLIDVAKLTRRWTDELHAEIPDTLVFERFPPAHVGTLRGAGRARVVYVHSQHDHMRLVTGGVVLPMLLRAATQP